jgi:hypothetical protein
MASRITQLMTVCGHGAFGMPRTLASKARTRETARKLMRASTKSCRAYVYHLDLGPSRETLKLGLELTQAGLSRFEGLGDLIVLGPQASMLFALVALPLTSLFGFGLPLVPAVSHFGPLAHDEASRVNSNGPRPRSGVQVGLKRSLEHKMIRDANTHSTPHEGRLSPTPEQGESMTDNQMEAKPIAGEHCRFGGNAKAPLVKTPWGQQWSCRDTAFMSFRGGGRCQVEQERFSLCYFHYEAQYGGIMGKVSEMPRLLVATR